MDTSNLETLNGMCEIANLPDHCDTHKHYPLMHPQYQSKTHCLFRISFEMVCLLIGSGIPDRADLYIDKDEELNRITLLEQKKISQKREDYGIKLLSLFVPWNSSEDLKLEST